MGRVGGRCARCVVPGDGREMLGCRLSFAFSSIPITAAFKVSGQGEGGPTAAGWGWQCCVVPICTLLALVPPSPCSLPSPGPGLRAAPAAGFTPDQPPNGQLLITGRVCSLQELMSLFVWHFAANCITLFFSPCSTVLLLYF